MQPNDDYDFTYNGASTPAGGYGAGGGGSNTTQVPITTAPNGTQYAMIPNNMLNISGSSSAAARLGASSAGSSGGTNWSSVISNLTAQYNRAVNLGQQLQGYSNAPGGGGGGSSSSASSYDPVTTMTAYQQAQLGQDAQRLALQQAAANGSPIDWANLNRNLNNDAFSQWYQTNQLGLTANNQNLNALLGLADIDYKNQALANNYNLGLFGALQTQDMNQFQKNLQTNQFGLQAYQISNNVDIAQQQLSLAQMLGQGDQAQGWAKLALASEAQDLSKIVSQAQVDDMYARLQLDAQKMGMDNAIAQQKMALDAQLGQAQADAAKMGAQASMAHAAAANAQAQAALRSVEVQLQLGEGNLQLGRDTLAQARVQGLEDLQFKREQLGEQVGIATQDRALQAALGFASLAQKQADTAQTEAGANYRAQLASATTREQTAAQAADAAAARRLQEQQIYASVRGPRNAFKYQEMFGQNNGLPAAVAQASGQAEVPTGQALQGQSEPITLDTFRQDSHLREQPQGWQPSTPIVFPTAPPPTGAIPTDNSWQQYANQYFNLPQRPGYPPAAAGTPSGTPASPAPPPPGPAGAPPSVPAGPTYSSPGVAAPAPVSAGATEVSSPPSSSAPITVPPQYTQPITLPPPPSNAASQPSQTVAQMYAAYMAQMAQQPPSRQAPAPPTFQWNYGNGSPVPPPPYMTGGGQIGTGSGLLSQFQPFQLQPYTAPPPANVGPGTPGGTGSTGPQQTIGGPAATPGPTTPASNQFATPAFTPGWINAPDGSKYWANYPGHFDANGQYVPDTAQAGAQAGYFDPTTGAWSATGPSAADVAANNRAQGIQVANSGNYYYNTMANGARSSALFNAGNTALDIQGALQYADAQAGRGIGIQGNNVAGNTSWFYGTNTAPQGQNPSVGGTGGGYQAPPAPAPTPTPDGQGMGLFGTNAGQTPATLGTTATYGSIGATPTANVDPSAYMGTGGYSSPGGSGSNLTYDPYTGGVPSYAMGTPRVQGDQLAVVHDGEAIIPAAQNPNNWGIAAVNAPTPDQIGQSQPQNPAYQQTQAPSATNLDSVADPGAQNQLGQNPPASEPVGANMNYLPGSTSSYATNLGIDVSQGNPTIADMQDFVQNYVTDPDQLNYFMARLRTMPGGYVLDQGLTGEIEQAIAAQQQPTGMTPTETSTPGASAPGPVVSPTYSSPVAGSVPVTPSTPDVGGSTGAPDDYQAMLNRYREALGSPTQWVGRNWLRMSPSQRDFMMGAAEALGYEPADVEFWLQKSLPGQAAYTGNYAGVGR